MLKNNIPTIVSVVVYVVVAAYGYGELTQRIKNLENDKKTVQERVDYAVKSLDGQIKQYEALISKLLSVESRERKESVQNLKEAIDKLLKSLESINKKLNNNLINDARFKIEIMQRIDKKLNEYQKEMKKDLQYLESKVTTHN